jgi:SHS family lactate transporter-like MFS transporter
MTGVVYVDEKPDLSAKSVLGYFKTRPTTLFDLPQTGIKSLNPMPALRAMKAEHWNWYFMGFFGWTIDSFDFFIVSASASAIAESLDVTITQITWALTLVLMLRSAGAVIFGLSSDYWCRKWPYIICCICFVALEVGMGFVKTYRQFLALRALFGICMGGK